tara:strand:- start:2397 stop:3509 length:1113 start_codon:yes stop_codon:yes gene_type:complete
MNKKIWLSSPHMGGGEQKYIQEAFDTNWIAPLGPNVNEFENSLQTYLNGNSYVATLSSGTAAIHLALVQLGVSNGDEVLCQSFTFSASANPILYQGATPVFIDSELETWNMCPIQLENAILNRLKNGKKPKAIIAVHLYGMPYNVNKINELGQKYQIPIIEDSAEALGSTYSGRKCGTFGDFSILSFNGNKIITTSGGGALVTKSIEQKEEAIFLASQARDAAPHYQHSKIGYNYRMSNIIAGIGRGQLEVLENRVLARRNNFNFYKTAIKSNQFMFLEEPEGSFSNRWLTCILTPSFEIREKIRLSFEKENIESRPLWKPMHLQPIFKNSLNFTNGTSENLFDVGLCLPSGSNITENELHRIVGVLNSF